MQTTFTKKFQKERKQRYSTYADKGEGFVKSKALSLDGTRQLTA